jgi:hypothetical protein
MFIIIEKGLAFLFSKKLISPTNKKVSVSIIRISHTSLINTSSEPAKNNWKTSNTQTEIKSNLV